MQIVSSRSASLAEVRAPRDMPFLFRGVFPVLCPRNYFKVIKTLRLILLVAVLAWKGLFFLPRRDFGMVAMSLHPSRRYAFNCLVRSSPQRLGRRLSSAASTRSQTREQIEVVKERGAIALSPRWLSELKGRIGKCISFGLRPEQVRTAGNVLQVVAREWRDLVAGSEGFLTGPGRAGLEQHRIVWGEMDSMVCMFFGHDIIDVGV
jgi:hypothetical protein